MKHNNIDLEIARKAKLKPITKIAESLGLPKDEFYLYGEYLAKVKSGILKRLKKAEDGKYVLVTAMTPTSLGEGKTVTTIGLSMALNRIGKSSVACIREPSLGPIFGIKGGAAGGGYSQVLPMEETNLHLTGDIHAVTSAHNLCSSFLDNSLYWGNHLGIKPETIGWPRVLDVSDRFLRNIRVGLNLKRGTYERLSRFDITSASEVMAVLSLSKNLQDLRKRLGNITLGLDKKNKPVTADDIEVAGSMAVLLKHAANPNLLQTNENTPCFVHTGPFGNIAHGNSSIIADRIALKLSDFVVTEAGFGADLGAEKFFDIKTRISKHIPSCAVLVCSVRALKAHSINPRFNSCQRPNLDLKRENLSALRKGMANLEKQIENVKIFGVPVVVAINQFWSDTQKEINLIKEKAAAFGAEDVVVSRLWAEGSKGGMDLAKAVIKASDKKKAFKFLYPLNMPIKDKIRTIALKIYGAKDVRFSKKAQDKMSLYRRLGYQNMPVCMAKTHLSLSHDPNLKGRPENFTLPVRDVHIATGAGFVYPVCAKIYTMPGLPCQPAGMQIDIDKDGQIKGLF